jgi:hypothetical protein
MLHHRPRVALVSGVTISNGEPPARLLKPDRKSISVKAVA